MFPGVGFKILLSEWLKMFVEIWFLHCGLLESWGYGSLYFPKYVLNTSNLVKEYVIWKIFLHSVVSHLLQISKPIFSNTCKYVNQVVSWKMDSLQCSFIELNTWHFNYISSTMFSNTYKLVKKDDRWKMVSPLCSFIKLSIWHFRYCSLNRF